MPMKIVFWLLFMVTFYLTGCGGARINGSMSLNDSNSQGETDSKEGTISKEGTVSKEDANSSEETSDSNKPSLPPPLLGLQAPQMLSARVWRLTTSQYLNSLEQLGFDPSSIRNKFSAEGPGTPFVTSGDLNIQPAQAEKYSNAAEILSEQSFLMGQNFFKKYASCDWSVAACQTIFVENFGLAVARKPLEGEFKQKLVGIFSAGASVGSPAEGVRYVVSALLQSPSFLYRSEVGAPAVVAGSNEKTKISQYELASLISFSLTDFPPDAELLKSASTNQLLTESQIVAQVNRLSSSPAAKKKLVQFLVELFGVNRLSGVRKDEALFPNYIATQSALQQSFEQDALGLLESTGADFASIFTLSAFSVNKDTYQSFNLPSVTSDTFSKMSVQASERKGLLTHPAVMASWSHVAESSPIERGKLVLGRLLCRPTGSPPDGAEAILSAAPKLPPGSTRRQQFARLLTMPQCAACHTSLNGVGFGLDDYDALGKYRTSDSIGKLDLQGTVENLKEKSGAETFVGGAQLSEMLAVSENAMKCFSLNTYRYFLGLGNDDKNLDAYSREKFVKNGAVLADSHAAIFTSPLTLERVK